MGSTACKSGNRRERDRNGFVELRRIPREIREDTHEDRNGGFWHMVYECNEESVAKSIVAFADRFDCSLESNGELRVLSIGYNRAEVGDGGETGRVYLRSGDCDQKFDEMGNLISIDRGELKRILEFDRWDEKGGRVGDGPRGCILEPTRRLMSYRVKNGLNRGIIRTHAGGKPPFGALVQVDIFTSRTKNAAASESEEVITSENIESIIDEIDRADCIVLATGNMRRKTIDYGENRRHLERLKDGLVENMHKCYWLGANKGGFSKHVTRSGESSFASIDSEGEGGLNIARALGLS